MTAPAPFDRRLLRQRRQRAAPQLAAHDFLLREIDDRLCDRLASIRRCWHAILDLGGRDGRLAARLAADHPAAAVTLCEAAPSLAAAYRGRAVVAEEDALPFVPDSFDLIVSNGALHTVNDLPGALIQARLALRPDGLLLAALPGGDSLIELRQILAEVEQELLGGLSRRLGPSIALADGAALLQRAGFALPVADRDRLTVRYADPLRLLADLRGAGEANILHDRHRAALPRRFWPEVAARYRARYADADGRVPVTVEILYLSGWAPAPGQQQPLRPGAASARLAAALGTVEQGSGDTAPPSRDGTKA